ncbi:MAG: hypothetical protein GXX99_06565 [Clostridiales bacterium]|nr:hypothetical protein [Clostridiales bacterium]
MQERKKRAARLLVAALAAWLVWPAAPAAAQPGVKPSFAEQTAGVELRQQVAGESAEGIADSGAPAPVIEEHVGHTEPARDITPAQRKELETTRALVLEKERALADLLSLDADEIVALRANQGLGDDRHYQLQVLVEQQVDALYTGNRSDEEIIETTLQALFFLEEKNFRDQKDYDFSRFLKAGEQAPGLAYFMDRLRFKKRWEQEYMNWPEYPGRQDIRSIQATVTEIGVSGGAATVTLLKEESALYGNLELVGFSWTTYTFTLEKANGCWCIADVRSDDPQEAYHLENNLKIDIEGRLRALREELQSRAVPGNVFKIWRLHRKDLPIGARLWQPEAGIRLVIAVMLSVVQQNMPIL